MLTRSSSSVNQTSVPRASAPGRGVARALVAEGLREAGHRPLDEQLWQWEDGEGRSVTLPRCDPISGFLAGKTLSIAGLGKRDTDELLHWRDPEGEA